MATLLDTSVALDTPWTPAGSTPRLPARAVGSVPVTAAPVGPATPTGIVALVTPWAAPHVRLPARATSLPSLAVGAVFPAPRQPAEALA